jgi:hypothetical protein
LRDPQLHGCGCETPHSATRAKVPRCGRSGSPELEEDTAIQTPGAAMSDWGGRKAHRVGFALASAFRSFSPNSIRS